MENPARVDPLIQNRNALNEINIVISEYTIKFLRPLKGGDTFEVTCEGEISSDNTKLIIHQEIKMNGKKFTDGVFLGTCVKATGGRSFLPDSLINATNAYRNK